MRMPAFLLACVLASGCNRDPATPAPPPPPASRVVVRGTGFDDLAQRAGIAFKMCFLPDEQGEHFKINLYDHGAGVAVADVDGDGFDDLYFCNQLGPNALYRNNGNGTFVETTGAAGADVALADRICVAAVFGDVDNDGDQDLYVTSTRGGNAFFRNEGGGKFADATERAGLVLVRHSQGAAFFDPDGDGDLDLFVTNTAGWTKERGEGTLKYFAGTADWMDLPKSPKEQNVFYRNRGDGTFQDATAEAGLGGVGWGGDVAVFDYDEDGRIDLLVTNMFGRSQLYRNEGGGKFAEVTRATLGRTSWGCIGSRAFDYDGDGRLDLYLVDMHSDMWMANDFNPRLIEEKRKHVRFLERLDEMKRMLPGAEEQIADAFQLKYDEILFGNSLFRNLGGGRFEEVSDAAGMETFWPWSIAVGDFQNDGHEDVFLACGMGYPYFAWRNYLMMNNGDGTFVDRSRETGIEPPSRGVNLEQKIGGKDAPRSSRSAAVADFDRDGCLDIVVNNFNDHPYLLMNRWAPRNWIELRLTGTRSNRDAIGALVRLRAGGVARVRQVQAAGGYLAQSSNVIHFGLGDATKVDEVEILWPSGTKQTIPNPTANTLHRVTEPKS